MSWADNKKAVTVLGKTMRYIEYGEGRPVLFLHGNPTSSYVWRTILPALADLGHLVAVDMIGMGDSDKLEGTDGEPGDYSFHTHYRFVSAFIDALGIGQDLALVMHDWGSAVGFHWANQHRSSVRCVAYMEGLVKPIHWEDWPADVRGFYEDIRSERGKSLVIEQNLFLEHILPGATITPLSEDDLAEYRRPFQKPEDRYPMLAWPRSIPIDGEPADMVELVENYGAWMCDAAMPKLLIRAEPGNILTGRQLEFAQCWRNQTEVVVAARHFVQEDAPDSVIQALRAFLAS